MTKAEHPIEGAIIGFDAHGKMQSAAWIQPTLSMSEVICRRECRRGGLAVDRFTVTEALEIMKQQGWGQTND